MRMIAMYPQIAALDMHTYKFMTVLAIPALVFSRFQIGELNLFDSYRQIERMEDNFCFCFRRHDPPLPLCVRKAEL